MGTDRMSLRNFRISLKPWFSLREALKYEDKYSAHFEELLSVDNSVRLWDLRSLQVCFEIIFETDSYFMCD
jgi:hypothetical protein